MINFKSFLVEMPAGLAALRNPTADKALLDFVISIAPTNTYFTYKNIKYIKHNRVSYILIDESYTARLEIENVDIGERTYKLLFQAYAVKASTSTINYSDLLDGLLEIVKYVNAKGLISDDVQTRGGNRLWLELLNVARAKGKQTYILNNDIIQPMLSIPKLNDKNVFKNSKVRFVILNKPLDK